jgi:hypothetical protein
MAGRICLSGMRESEMQFYNHEELVPMQPLPSSNKRNCRNDFSLDQFAFDQVVLGYLPDSYG